MIPWLEEPDRWINLRDFCRIFNYSYRAWAVGRKLVKTGILSDPKRGFGMQTCCIILEGKSNCAMKAKWYVRLND